ncbi:hypothetical protein M8J76_008380 [Diaphorina citri]|nr:hypothetical protein M8J76_008380 [Diaphorina citri]
MADRTMQPSEYLTYSCAPAQQIFKPKLQVVTESELPFKLSSEDISMIHKCLNRFVSTSYSPLDDSVFDSFFYYMEFLYKSPTLVLEEKVTDLFGHEYKTFDEAYDKTYKMINKAIDHSLITSEENYSLNSVFRDKQTYKKMYEKAWMKEYSCVHQKFQDKLETSKRTDLHFLTTAELESWIILMKENFVQLKRSAQQFVLKFIGLISQNVNCFLLLQSHAVFDMFYHMFLAQDFTFRSLFVKTLNFLLSHKEGRCYVTQASDMWKAVIQMELQSKESNYYYREILVDFIMNLTIVPHQLVFTNKKIVTQNFFKILSFIDLHSKVHMTFLYKLLQKLLSSYSSTEIAYDDMSSIMRTVEKILRVQIKSPEQLSLDMACTYFQIRTHVDRLSMNYDNEMQTIQSGAHQEFLLKTIWNLECLLNLVVIHIYEHKYDSEDAYNKFLDYAELCCVIYLSRTPAFNSIQPEYNKRNENNNSEEVETCCNTFHNIIKMILFPIFHVLENQLKSYNPTFKFIFNVNLCKTDLKVGLNAENSISAALKSFACFRRIYPLIQQDRFLDTLCRLELQPLLIPLMTKPRWGLFNATPISSYFEHMCNALPECTVEWLRMIEYMCHKERDVFFSFSHMYTLLSCAVHNNQEKIVQTLLTVQQYLLRNYPNHCVLTGTLMEKESDWVVIKLLNSESWIIRDSVLEVLNLDIALRSIQRRAFPKECSDLTKVSSEITRYILLSEKDPERFVRASAVRILHWKLEICVECNFGEAMSDEMVSQKNNLKNVVLDTLFRICYNEEETIVKVQVIDRLCNLYREDDHHEIFELKSSRFHELLEVMKYFAIKDLEHEVKAEANQKESQSLQTLIFRATPVAMAMRSNGGFNNGNATIETIRITRPLKVIALICGMLVIVLMCMSLMSTDWLMAAGWRQGLFEHCVSEFAPTPLPFNVKHFGTGAACYPARDSTYIRVAAILCIVTLVMDLIASLLTGLGIRSKDNRTKRKFYKGGVYFMVLSLLSLLTALIVYPVFFFFELNQGNRQVWEFGWAYGVGWGASIFLFGGIVLLLLDKESEEVYYKERKVTSA